MWGYLFACQVCNGGRLYTEVGGNPFTSGVQWWYIIYGGGEYLVTCLVSMVIIHTELKNSLFEQSVMCKVSPRRKNNSYNHG